MVVLMIGRLVVVVDVVVVVVDEGGGGGGSVGFGVDGSSLIHLGNALLHCPVAKHVSRRGPSKR